jgi:hypothetical protein
VVIEVVGAAVTVGAGVVAEAATVGFPPPAVDGAAEQE